MFTTEQKNADGEYNTIKSITDEELSEAFQVFDLSTKGALILGLGLFIEQFFNKEK